MYNKLLHIFFKYATLIKNETNLTYRKLMKIYNILTFTEDKLHPSSLFIEEKFSLSALFLQFIWLIYRRLWIQSITVLIAQIILLLLLKTNIINNVTFISIELVLFFIVGSFANTWYIKNLIKRKYKLSHVIIANNLDEARLRFYQITSTEREV